MSPRDHLIRAIGRFVELEDIRHHLAPFNGMTGRVSIDPVQQDPNGGEKMGSVMMQRAKEAAADLIVMGAYDHFRLREVVCGGTTQTLIDQRDRPVMLCH